VEAREPWDGREQNVDRSDDSLPKPTSERGQKDLRDGQRVVDLVFAGRGLDKAFFDRMTERRPRIRLTVRQRTRVLDQWPQE
jgi:hypothetical protein